MLVEDEESHADEDGVEFAPLTTNCDIGIQKLFREKARITCESSKNKPTLFSLVCGLSVDDHGKLPCQESIHHRDDKNICSR